jgi:hypothetical protein
LQATPARGKRGADVRPGFKLRDIGTKFSFPIRLKARAMNTPDEDLVLRAVEDARRILVEYIAGPRDATQTVHRLLAILDEVELGRALDRIKRRRTMRLVE